MPSSVADSSHIYFCNSSKYFSRSRKTVTERDLYPLLKGVIGVAVCINVARASIILIPLLKHKRILG